VRSLYAQMSRLERKFSTVYKSRKPEQAEHRLNVNPSPKSTSGQEARQNSPAHHIPITVAVKINLRFLGTRLPIRDF
jgi:hypothetical protein